MRKETLPDFSDYFTERAKQRILLERTFVAIDDSLNMPQISELTEKLRSQYLITNSGFLGEIRAGSKSGVPGHISFIGDTGTPNLQDIEVLRLLLSRFNEFRKVIFLSETLKKDPKGIRTLLKNAVQPAIVHFHTALNGDQLSLAAIFRKPETSIEDYCRKVAEFVKSHQAEPEFIEILV